MREIKRFSSIVEAAKFTGIATTTISDACNSVKHAGRGYKWFFVDDVPQNVICIDEAIKINDDKMVLINKSPEMIKFYKKRSLIDNESCDIILPYKKRRLYKID